MNITAKDVAKLREMTGAGMMDCKGALVEAEGDFDLAIEVLRKKGQKMLAKRADRDTNEGVVIAKTSADGKRGIVMNLCCETDFVAKNDDFIAFAQSIADLALEAFPTTVEELNALKMGNGTVADATTEKTGVVGEKIEVKAFERLEGALIVPYIHMGYRAGVIATLSKGGDDKFVEAGKNVTMQIAAMRPVAVDKDGVSQAVIDKEVEIRKELAMNDPKNAGKPAEMLEKIAVGSLNKFFEESTLLNQEYVKGNKQKVRDYLTSIDKELTVTAFKHIALK